MTLASYFFAAGMLLALPQISSARPINEQSTELRPASVEARVPGQHLEVAMSENVDAMREAAKLELLQQVEAESSATLREMMQSEQELRGIIENSSEDEARSSKVLLDNLAVARAEFVKRTEALRESIRRE